MVREIRQTDLQRYFSWVLESISKLQQYSSGMTKEEFLDDEKTLDSCLMQLQHIGETIIQINKYFPDIAFAEQEKIIGLRHYISHEYKHIRPSMIWFAIKEKIPILEKEIEKLYSTIML